MTSTPNPELRRLVDAVLAVGADLELPLVLERIAAAARELVGARYAALGVLDERRERLAQFITVGMTEAEKAAIGELPAGHGILGLLIREPAAIRLPDLTAHPDSRGFPPHHPPMTSFLGVPLYVRGEVFGNLYLTDKEGGAGFTDADEELVRSLAAAAAVTIENARLHRALQERTLLDDRERIAHQLHDLVIQRLLGIGMVLQATIPLVDRREAADRLHRMVDELDDAVRDIRSAVFRLDTHRSPGRSLRLEVVELAADAGRGLGFDPVVQLEGPIDTAVTEEVGEHVLAVLREALSNVARHADATGVEVRLSAGSELELEILDDGSGLRPDRRSGSGLRNMARRAADLGGRCEVGPGSRRGTRVRWVVPLRTGAQPPPGS